MKAFPFVFAMIVVWTLGGCSLVHRPLPTKAVDRDFIATVASPGSNTISIEVRKTNPRARKEILFPASGMGFVLIDPSGKTLKERVDYGVKRQKTVPSAAHLVERMTAEIKIERKAIPPGVYTVTPKVHIVEEGRDRIATQREDLGSVDVPPGNSIRVDLR